MVAHLLGPLVPSHRAIENTALGWRGSLGSCIWPCRRGAMAAGLPMGCPIRSPMRTCRRFADTLAGTIARLGADVGGYLHRNGLRPSRRYRYTLIPRQWHLSSNRSMGSWAWSSAMTSATSEPITPQPISPTSWSGGSEANAEPTDVRRTASSSKTRSITGADTGERPC
jgi:hypothetical protein